MSAFLNFDATQVDPRDEFQPVPAGSYSVIITESEIKDTKNGSGNYLKLALEIQDGEYRGRKIFHNITLQNQNQTAVSIGQKHLSQICHAVNVLQVHDSQQLHFRPLIAVVKIRKGDGQYGDSNEVQRYEAMPTAPGFQPQHRAETAPPVQQQRPVAQATAPWAAQR